MEVSRQSQVWLHPISHLLGDNWSQSKLSGGLLELKTFLSIHISEATDLYLYGLFSMRSLLRAVN